MTDQQRAPVVKALFVRLIAQDGKGNEVERFLTAEELARIDRAFPLGPRPHRLPML